MYKLLPGKHWQLGVGREEKVEMVFFSFPGLKKDCSQPLDVCYFVVLTLGQQLLKGTDKLLSGKDWEMGLFPLH